MGEYDPSHFLSNYMQWETEDGSRNLPARFGSNRQASICGVWHVTFVQRLRLPSRSLLHRGAGRGWLMLQRG